MDLTIRQPTEMLTTGLLVKHLAGSKAYGTNLPTSDTDIRGIFCADEIYYRSPWYTVNEISIPEEEDTKYYELSNFMKLLVDQNPNIIETLWLDDSAILETSPAYDYLRSKRYELLSSKTAYTFSGYALSQLKRIKGHHKWINNPQPVDQPRQVDFLSLIQNFTSTKLFKMSGDAFVSNYREDYRLIPYGGDIFGLYKASGYQTCDDIFTLNTNNDDVDRTKFGVPEMIIKFNKEEYRRVKAEWSNYWTWKKERNVARSELEEHFGYDTKHAMHLIRLLRMGKEILSQGEVIVLRPDAAELLDIRNGKLSYEELVTYAETIDKEIRHELYNSTKLRKRVDPRVATSILFRTQEIAWGR